MGTERVGGWLAAGALVLAVAGCGGSSGSEGATTTSQQRSTTTTAPTTTTTAASTTTTTTTTTAPPPPPPTTTTIAAPMLADCSSLEAQEAPLAGPLGITSSACTDQYGAAFFPAASNMGYAIYRRDGAAWIDLYADNVGSGSIRQAMVGAGVPADHAAVLCTELVRPHPEYADRCG